MDSISIVPSKDDRKQQEEDFLLQKHLVQRKMYEKRLKKSKSKKIFHTTVILLLSLLILAIIVLFLCKFGTKSTSKQLLTKNSNIGIPRSRQNRAHKLISSRIPKITEFVTPFFGFFKTNNTILTGDAYNNTDSNKFVKTPPSNEFFELKKNGELEHNEYAIFVIEKNHKRTGNALVLQYAKIGKQCFEVNNYCIIGEINEAAIKMKYLSFKKFKAEWDEDEIDGLSSDFLILLVRNSEELEDWEFDETHNIKYFVLSQMQKYFTSNTVDAVFIGNFGDNENEWIKKIKHKLNIHPVEFPNESKKSYILCDNIWKTAEPSPNADNHCNTVSQHDEQEKVETDSKFYFPCEVVEVQQWECKDENEISNVTMRTRRQSSQPLSKSSTANCKINWKKQLKVGDEIHFKKHFLSYPFTGIITKIVYDSIKNLEFDPKFPIKGFIVKSPLLVEVNANPKGLESVAEKWKFLAYVGRSMDFIIKFYLHFFRNDFLQFPPDENEWVVLKIYEGHVATCYEFESLFQHFHEDFDVPTLENQVIEPFVSYKIFEGNSVDENLLKVASSYIKQHLISAFESGTEITKNDALKFIQLKRKSFMQVLHAVNRPAYDAKNEKRKIYRHQHREENKEEYIQREQQYRENNKEIIQQRKQKYHEKNKEKINKYQRKYNEEHKEEQKEYQRKYNEEHKEEQKESQRKYREKLRQLYDIYENENLKIPTYIGTRKYKNDGTTFEVEIKTRSLVLLKETLRLDYPEIHKKYNIQ